MSAGAFSPPAKRDSPAVERMRINFSWVLKLRWAAAAGQLITIAAVAVGLGVDLPMTPLLVLVALQAISNIPLEIWHARSADAWDARSQHLLGLVMAFDVLLVSGLLYWSGGPANPFAVFYLVHITLATVVLSVRWAWIVAAMSVICFALLFPFHYPLPVLGQATLSPVKPAAGASGSLYFNGMLVAFTAASVFIVYFITRVTSELAQLAAELYVAEQRKAETEKLEALGTLAAGAAHELASPLSTIAVVAKELEKQLEKLAGSAEAPEDHPVHDARLIRTEVTRCREILDQMAVNAGESVGEGLMWLTPEELLAASKKGLRDAERIAIEVDDAARQVRMFLPKHALAQALRGLLKNSLDASGDDQPVTAEATTNGRFVRISISDAGSGMPADVLARAGNPFFTTKEPGKGMGLGLFLARKVIERLGGEMRIESSTATGTVVAVELPCSEGVSVTR